MRTSVLLLLFVSSLFSFVSGMAIYRTALQGVERGWIAILFLGGIFFFTVCFGGSVIRAFIQRRRPESSGLPTVTLATSLLWGSAIAVLSAIAGAITPPSQELLLAGFVFLCLGIPALIAVITILRGLSGPPN
jgi:hypothetical protein